MSPAHHLFSSDAIVGYLLGFIYVDELLVNVSCVCVQFRNIILKSNVVWLNSYANTWGVSMSAMMDFRQDWKVRSLTRYRLDIANSPDLFSYTSEFLNHTLKTEVNAQLRFNLGLFVDEAYQVMAWAEDCRWSLRSLLNEAAFPVSIMRRAADRVEGKERSTLQNVSDKIQGSALLKDTSGATIIQDVVATLQCLSLTRSRSPDPSAQFYIYARINHVHAEFILYNRAGLPCLFSYKHSRLKSENVDKFVPGRRNTTKPQLSLCFNSKQLFDEQMFDQDAMNEMKIHLLGPEANDVSNELLLGVLCTIGASADRWGYQVKRRDPVFTSNLVSVFSTIVPKAIYEPPPVSNFPLSTPSVSVPKWVNILLPRPILFFGLSTSSDAEQILLAPHDLMDKAHKLTVEIIGKQDSQVVDPTKYISIRTLDFAHGDSLKHEIRLVMFSCAVGIHVQIWIASKKLNAEHNIGLFAQLTASPTFCIPLECDKKRRNFLCENAEFAHFILHSAITQRKVAVWFKAGYATLVRRTQESDFMEIHCNIDEMPGITHQPKVARVSEILQEGDAAYQYKMACSFALIKKLLFGAQNVPVSFQTTIEFFCMLARSSCVLSQDLNDILLPQTQTLIQQFVTSHEKAWEKSNLIDDASLVAFESAQSARHIEPTSKQPQIEHLLKEQRQVAAQARVLTSDSLPFSTYSFSQYARVQPSCIVRIPHSDSFLPPYGVFRIDTSNWPPTMEESIAYLTQIMFSHEGDQYIGVHSIYTFSALLLTHQIPSTSEELYMCKTGDPKEIFSKLQLQMSNVGDRAVADPIMEDPGKYEGLEPLSSDGYGANAAPSSDITAVLDKPKPLGFIAGRLLLGANFTYGPLPFLLQISPHSLNFEISNLPEGLTARVILLPNRNSNLYAAEGVLLRGCVFQLNVQTSRFERIIVRDESGNHFGVYPSQQDANIENRLHANYGSDNRLFYVQHKRLFEAVWTKENTLVFVEHMPGLYAITAIMATGSIGLVLTCFPLMPLNSSPEVSVEITCVIYYPEPQTPCHGTIIEVPITAFGLCKVDRSLEKVDSLIYSTKANLTQYQPPTKAVRNLFWSESKKLLIALEDAKVPSEFELGLIKCTHCHRVIPDNFYYDYEGPTHTQVCQTCFKFLRNIKDFIKKDLNQFPKIVQDVKVDGETVLRAIHLVDLHKLGKRSSLELHNKEKLTQLREFSFYKPPQTQPWGSMGEGMWADADGLWRRLLTGRSTDDHRIREVFELRSRTDANTNEYSCFAVWERSPSLIPTCLTVPKDILQVFTDPADLIASFLGGPIFFQSTKLNCIYYADILDFIHHQKSDAFLASIRKTPQSFVEPLYLSDIQWIGVVGHFPQYAIPDRDQVCNVQGLHP